MTLKASRSAEARRRNARRNKRIEIVNAWALRSKQFVGQPMNFWAFEWQIIEIAKLRESRKSMADSEIGKIKEEISGFPNQVKNGKNWKEKQYQEKELEIVEKVRKLKSRGSNIRPHWGEISDFEAEEFYGFLRWFRTEKDKIQTDFRKDVEFNEFTILTYDGKARHFEIFKGTFKFP